MPKLCKCGAIVDKRCERCQPSHNQTTKQRGYGNDWRKLSIHKRTIDPLCEHCLTKGMVKPATEVHHIIAIARAPHKRLDIDNLMSVCHACHEELEAGGGPGGG
jgi:5-methylcytosine-specific restriction endonuclease McrA